MKNVSHKLPNGVAVIFFDNVGWLHEDGNFTSYGSAGYFIAGYTHKKRLSWPSEKTRIERLRTKQGLVALTMQLTLFNKERRNIILFGELYELMSVKEELRNSFASGKPLVINTNMVECDNLPFWWSEK